MRKFATIVSGVLIILMLFSCKHDRLKIDVSSIKADVYITRLDQMMFGVDQEKLDENLAIIKANHLDFFDIYTSYVLNIGTTSSPDFYPSINTFVHDSVYSKVGNTVITQFSNLEPLKSELIKGFKHYLYYLPNSPIPRIYTCVSGFNKSVFVCNSGIGVSLDWYLGKDCVYYSYLGIPQYKRNNRYPQKMVPDVFNSIYFSDFPYNDSLNNLLSNMIYQGKGIYFTKAMCPSLPDSVIMGFTSKQLKWCRNNEGKMWTYLVERKVIFENERLTLQRYMGDAPFTNTFSNDSPGRTGCWLGYRIICSFMKNNPDISLKDLLSMNNSQQILNRSGYFPD